MKPAFTESELDIARIEGVIRGTLITPSRHADTLYIFIAGSGPTDRNGNQLGMTNNTYMKVCETFAEIGIATFRYDKRGIGKSHFPTLNEETLTIDHYVEDVIWIARYFTYRFPKLNIGLVGHSEGGLIALLAATKMQVENLVLLATSGRRIDDVVLEQIQRRAPSLYNEASNILARLKQGKTTEFVNASLWGLCRPSIQHYMMSLLRYSPRELMRSRIAKTVIIQGARDIQTTPLDAEVLYAAASPCSELNLIPTMNHMPVHCSSNLEDNLASYSDPSRPLHPELNRRLKQF